MVRTDSAATGFALRCAFAAALSLASACGSAVGAPAHATITDGATTNADWNTALKAAVPLGVTVDSAIHVLSNNDMECFLRTAVKRQLLGCQKMDGNAFIGRRNGWRAEFAVADNRIVSVRGFYDRVDGLFAPSDSVKR